MKYTFAFVLIVSLLVSCSNKKDEPGTNDPVLLNSTWRVSYYWDKKDETGNFSTYVFMFGNGGIFMAHQGAAMFTGIWGENNGRLNISFSETNLSKLNNNWLITEKTANSLRLKDDNPQQDDQLYFIKN
jgi:hypothetical protein